MTWKVLETALSHLNMPLLQQISTDHPFTLIRNFFGMFPKKTEIVEFPKYEPFNRKFQKFWEEIQLERKDTLRDSEKLGTPCEIDLFS